MNMERLGYGLLKVESESSFALLVDELFDELLGDMINLSGEGI